MRLAVVVFLGSLAVSACFLGWDEVDDCGVDEVCLACQTDDDCVAGYTCCGKTWSCYHRQEDKAMACSLGCWTPDPSPCGCIDGRCQFH